MKKTSLSEKTRLLNCRGRNLVFKRTPLVMGILNVTPDSFSDGGRFFDADRAIQRALQLVEDGADIIDIGGESTRPGSEPVSAKEELERILPILKAVIDKIDIPISIDTRKARVAHEALESGCHLINDVSACQDPEMIDVVHEYRSPIVIMHMKGDPKTMQDAPNYDDVYTEIRDFLSERAELLLAGGIPSERIIIDPGIGFGKRFRDNLDLLRNIGRFREMGYPVLIGASRKRFIGELLNVGTDHRLPGSLAVAARCYSEGIEILRVHEVKETVNLLRVLDAMAHPDAYYTNS
jgi:dihydropteroate synthase